MQLALFCLFVWHGTSQAQNKAIPRNPNCSPGHGDAFARSGALRPAAAARQKGVLGLDSVALRIGFITHLHS